MIRDLLNLEVDPAKYLPSDDSTHGFDNIAGTLGISSTLVEAYVSAAEKSAAWRSAQPKRRLLSSIAPRKTRRRPITSKVSRSAHAVECSSSTCSRPQARTRLR